MIDVYLPLDVPSVVEQTVALALSGGPSPVFLQAVEQVASFKKAFRRQGIGVADVVNTARFFLSRLESLFASQKAFQIFRGRAGRDCVIYSVPLPLLSINPTDSPRHASRLWRSLFLVKVCARAGKTVISRPNVCASGSCRGLTSLPPMAFAVSFRIRCRGRENRRQTP